MTPSDIKTLRAKHGLTQRECAELIHVTTRSWQRFESGDRTPHPAFIELLTIKLERRMNNGYYR